MTKEEAFKYPSVRALRASLVASNRDLDSEADVRLQVTRAGWSLHVGPSDYDQDHRGWWGASSLPGRGKRFHAEDLARDLISQAREQEETTSAEVRAAESRAAWDPTPLDDLGRSGKTPVFRGFFVP